MLIKLDLGGLKGQFDVKKANFRGLIAKIGHYRPILAIRPHLQPIFMDYAMRIVTYAVKTSTYQNVARKPKNKKRHNTLLIFCTFYLRRGKVIVSILLN